MMQPGSSERLLLLWGGVATLVIVGVVGLAWWLMKPVVPDRVAVAPSPLSSETDSPALGSGNAALDRTFDEARHTLDALSQPSTAPSSPPSSGATAATSPTTPDSTASPTATTALAPEDGASSATPPVRIETRDAAATEDPNAPRFDVVRVEPNGSAVMAGRATPGATVSILDGNREIGRTEADDRGQWVFIPETPLPPGERQLSLVSRDAPVVTATAQPSDGIAPGATPRTTPSATTAPIDMDTTAQAGGPPSGSPPSGRTSSDSSSSGAPSSSLGQGAVALTSQSPSGSLAAPSRQATGEPTAHGEIALQGHDLMGKASPGHDSGPASESFAASSPTLTAASNLQASGHTAVTERRSATVVVLSIPAPHSGSPVLVLETPRDATGSARSLPRLLQGPSAPGAETSLQIGMVDYTARGGLTLSGTAQPGATVQLYLDNRPLVRVTADTTGSWQAIPHGRDITEKLYTLRADEVDGSGAVTERVELPFQPTDLNVRAANADETLVVVQPGNNLWTVARTVYGEGTAYTTIYAANKDQIRDPDLIYPGQVFSIPKTEGTARN